MTKVLLLLFQLCLFLSIVGTPVYAHETEHQHHDLEDCDDAIAIASNYPETGVAEQLQAMSDADCMAFVNSYDADSFNDLVNYHKPMLLEHNNGLFTVVKGFGPKPYTAPHSHDIPEMHDTLENSNENIESALSALNFLRSIVESLENILMNLWSH